MVEKEGRELQKLNTFLAVTIQSITLSSVEAASLYKTNTVLKLKMKANDEPDLVYRPQGEHYNPQYTRKCSGHVSFHCWGWISHEGAGVLHRIEGHLDGLQYQHILQNVMVPSVRMLCPNGIIHLQQDHSPVHDSCVVQEWLSRQADIELLDWPPRAPDMNSIEKMWSEVKSTMQETWPVLPPRNSDELWTLVSNTWDEVASSTHYIRSMMESMTRQMKSVVEAEGFWTSY